MIWSAFGILTKYDICRDGTMTLLLVTLLKRGALTVFGNHILLKRNIRNCQNTCSSTVKLSGWNMGAFRVKRINIKKYKMLARIYLRE